MRSAGRTTRPLRLPILIALAASLAACSSGEEEELDGQTLPPPGPGNAAPTISGSPTTSAEVGVAYSFRPTANDPDGDALVFSIQNRPAWATFSVTTGRLQGTPDAAGTVSNISISVTDGAETANLAPFTITVTEPTTPPPPPPPPPPPNAAPTISGSPATSVQVGTAYAFTPTASDADGDALSFAIAGRPSWATFSSSTGRMQGVPPTAGTFANIRIGVTDGEATTLLPAFTITVTAAPPTNRAPTISGSPATSVQAGTMYSFTPTASDADGNPLTFAIANRPAWATFSTSTGRLQGTPTAAGTFTNISISVSDGTAIATLPTFAITVTAAPNTPPTISGNPAPSAQVGTLYSFTPTADDADDDPLTFSITGAPSWATFSTSTGRLQGTPTAAGTFSNISISVSDGEDTDSLQAFTITVTDSPNTPPTISGTPPTSVLEGVLYSFTPTANDADDDPLTFSIANEPSWATFSTSTGRLSGTPDAGDVGTYSNIGISVSDGTASASLSPFTITVTALATGSATLTWTAPTQNDDGSPLTDLASYRVHWGTASRNYSNSATITNPGVTTYVVESLLPGRTYFFALTAGNSDGLYSDYSVEASKAIP